MGYATPGFLEKWGLGPAPHAHTKEDSLDYSPPETAGQVQAKTEGEDRQ